MNKEQIRAEMLLWQCIKQRMSARIRVKVVREWLGMGYSLSDVLQMNHVDFIVEFSVKDVRNWTASSHVV